MLKEDGGLEALLGMVRSETNDVTAQITRGIANFAKCESLAVIQGHRKGRSLLMEDGALEWLLANSDCTSTSIKRHIELALCHLAQNRPSPPPVRGPPLCRAREDSPAQARRRRASPGGARPPAAAGEGLPRSPPLATPRRVTFARVSQGASPTPPRAYLTARRRVAAGSARAAAALTQGHLAACAGGKQGSSPASKRVAAASAGEGPR
ncbi:hypothetical protein NL676_004093 [Syzygium grande]|nr:hypothetical protein NL676_004093 [Syzygium grande]